MRLNCTKRKSHCGTSLLNEEGEMDKTTATSLVDLGEGMTNKQLRAFMLETQPSQDMAQRLARIEAKLDGLLIERQNEKEWYRTDEVAEILGKSDFTVREKWCNQGRIEAVKDEESGKWKIPGHEVQRLRNGGSLRPQRK
jgi:hypothetical protein